MLSVVNSVRIELEISDARDTSARVLKELFFTFRVKLRVYWFYDTFIIIIIIFIFLIQPVLFIFSLTRPKERGRRF